MRQKARTGAGSHGAPREQGEEAEEGEMCRKRQPGRGRQAPWVGAEEHRSTGPGQLTGSASGSTGMQARRTSRTWSRRAGREEQSWRGGREGGSGCAELVDWGGLVQTGSACCAEGTSSCEKEGSRHRENRLVWASVSQMPLRTPQSMQDRAQGPVESWSQVVWSVDSGRGGP